MHRVYTNIHFLHALDESTQFLSVFEDFFSDFYTVIESNDHSLNSANEILRTSEPKSLIVFLGHGYSTGIYSPLSQSNEKKVFVDIASGNDLFRGHDLILLSCKSSDFIRSLTTFSSAIGFGNIISSMEESSVDAEYTGRFRNLAQEDIEYFNNTYVETIAEGVKLLIANKVEFKELPRYILFKINQKINNVLKQKGKSNRVELARLLFEFRNEMSFKQH